MFIFCLILVSVEFANSMYIAKRIKLKETQSGTDDGRVTYVALQKPKDIHVETKKGLTIKGEAYGDTVIRKYETFPARAVDKAWEDAEDMEGDYFPRRMQEGSSANILNRGLHLV